MVMWTHALVHPSPDSPGTTDQSKFTAILFAKPPAESLTLTPQPNQTWKTVSPGSMQDILLWHYREQAQQFHKCVYELQYSSLQH
jgi:hypothetical protein